MGEKMAEEEFSNTTHENFNFTLHTTLGVTTRLVLPTPAKPILPVQTGEQAQQEEQSSGMTIFFSLLVLGEQAQGSQFPATSAVLGLKVSATLPGSKDDFELLLLFAFTSLDHCNVALYLTQRRVQPWRRHSWEKAILASLAHQLASCPSVPPSQGNFFQNIGSITLFAVFGTAISAFVVGGGIYFLGQADVIFKLNMTDSFAFGSLISAVDPVATIAIFNALHVDPVLNMLVFGESILNDAVSIVLTNTAEGLTRKHMSDVSGWQTFSQALGYFLKMFFGSAALGTLTGLISALVLKHIDLRRTPSLEFGMMIIFAYLPYGLAEGISLSGIMAILFSGIVMSHYTHHNLSPVTQILMQQTLRTVAFLCETCVFAFLGLSIFSFPHKFEISFVIWCIVLVLFGRAVNIFPLSYLLNFFRDHKITPKMMFIMWFSGLRGAIPYALSLHLGLEPMEKRQLIGTTTIVIVLFTILLLGGSTMPLIRLVDIEDARARRRNKKDVNLSKTEKMGNAIESEHLSELTEEEYEAHYIRQQDLKGFMWLDAKYLNPFFTRRLTQEDLHHGRIQMKSLTNKWYEEVRQGPSGSEDDEQELF
ncbi:sodium/hydrogen exchanger 8 [Alexandromys fortis]|uniref:sodium/hydrogen exchanger 8 n=1 Tax=Alexandromys fortis TaxID=100897 RepID=UPI002152379D|nr:sodium/hydrogen exchanger 8 [Microtus fortis]